MVLRNQYVLEDSASGRDLNTETPLRHCLRRGMKLNMSMVFETMETVAGTCPRCHMVTDTHENVSVQW